MELLQDKIWITRKSRIEASERLLKNAFHSHLLTNYYATYVVIISIYDLYDKNNDLSLLIVVGSILVLMSSLFMSTKNFKERSNFLKTCYIKLELLQDKIKALEETEKKSNYLEISKEYNDILLNSENHLPEDFIKVKLSIQKEKRQQSTQIATTEYISHATYLFMRSLSLVVLYFTPVIITFLYVFNASI